jgi:hypothetical protein
MTEQADTREGQMVVVERDDSGKPTVWCDPEVAPLVAALNGAGFRTVASCSGHGKRPASIVLSDGREIIIAKDFDEARKIDGLFPGINGEPATIAAPAPVERVEQEAVSYYERAHGEKSPTHGMNLDERIAHVGGRTNAAGYVEFGSVMAVSALIDHVLRDSPAPQPAPAAAQDVANQDGGIDD